jgi:hypothetical protein
MQFIYLRWVKLGKSESNNYIPFGDVVKNSALQLTALVYYNPNLMFIVKLRLSAWDQAASLLLLSWPIYRALPLDIPFQWKWPSADFFTWPADDDCNILLVALQL